MAAAPVGADTNSASKSALFKTPRLKNGGFLHFNKLFYAFKKAGLKISVHAGEYGEKHEIEIALDQLCADRLGHGLAAFLDEKLLRIIESRHVHLEFCLSSNHLTGAWADCSSHPIKIAHAMGLSYSINTDDPGTFNCYLTDEIERASKICNYTQLDYERVYSNTLAARFDSKAIINSHL